MEDPHTDRSLFDISFDEQVKQSLKGTAVWAGLAAIVSIIGSALGVVNYFVQRGKITSYRGYDGTEVRQASEAGGFISVFIALIIGIVLFVFLNKFSRKTRSGVDQSDQYQITEGLGSLATYFKFLGVLLIIALTFIGLALLAGLGSV